MVETRSPRILLVEDSLVDLLALENALRAVGYEVVTAMTARDALSAASAQLPDLMILDLTLDTKSFETFRDGFSLLHWLRHTLGDAHFPVVIHTVDPSPLVDERARAAGVFAVIRKGDSAADILHVVHQAVATGDSDEAGAAA